MLFIYPPHARAKSRNNNRIHIKSYFLKQVIHVRKENKKCHNTLFTNI